MSKQKYQTPIVEVMEVTCGNILSASLPLSETEVDSSLSPMLLETTDFDKYLDQ